MLPSPHPSWAWESASGAHPVIGGVPLLGLYPLLGDESLRIRFPGLKRTARSCERSASDEHGFLFLFDIVLFDVHLMSGEESEMRRETEALACALQGVLDLEHERGPLRARLRLADIILQIVPAEAEGESGCAEDAVPCVLPLLPARVDLALVGVLAVAGKFASVGRASGAGHQERDTGYWKAEREREFGDGEHRQLTVFHVLHVHSERDGGDIRIDGHIPMGLPQMRE